MSKASRVGIGSSGKRQGFVLGLALTTVVSCALVSGVARKSVAASLTAAERPCQGARSDGDIYAVGLGHNTFDAFYRSPFGAVRTDHGSVQVRLRACRGDIDRARIRIWNSVQKSETWVTLSRDSEATDSSLGPVEYWKGSVPVPKGATLLYYFFEIGDRGDTRYYVDDDPQFHGGGWGRYSERWNDLSTFQITVYDKDFRVPDWAKGAVIYQIFPDRFRNGDPSNDPVNGTGFIFNQKVRKLDWSQPLCDPWGEGCYMEFGNQFYGGDLQGVIEKLDYLKDLGVRMVYLNPVFQSSFNHGYDTQDYFLINSRFGDLNSFRRLVSEAKTRGIHVVLDGVFNHMSSDSRFFDVFNRWEGTGACEATESPYRNWFNFHPIMSWNPRSPAAHYVCRGYDGALTTYDSWWGFLEYPEFNVWEPAVRDLVFARGVNSVAPYWIRQGASGWRLDVAGDVDKGHGVEPENTYWEGFRRAVKAEDPEAVIIGEEWGDASPLLTGIEMDSSMNYRFRAALLGWVSDGCTGPSCPNGTFEDDDHYPGSNGGPIAPITESDLDLRLRSIQEDYPEPAWHSMMNLVGSHDTQRVLFVLKKISWDYQEMAKRKLKFLSLFQFTYPGAPVIYYGDEVGATADGRVVEGRWKDDPYNRVVYPWEDQGLSPDKELLRHFQRLATIRNASSALRTGSYETVLADDSRRLFAFRRMDRTQHAWVVLNRSMNSQRVSIAVSGLEDGTVLKDALNGGTVTVSGGRVDLGELSPLWGRVLIAEKGSKSGVPRRR